MKLISDKKNHIFIPNKMPEFQLLNNMKLACIFKILQLPSHGLWSNGRRVKEVKDGKGEEVKRER